MNEWLSFVVFPAVGAAIGAFTNQVAIRMLFRPYVPLVVGGVRLPFTPGVIPAQRRKISATIARTFEANLFSGEDLRALLTGERVRAIVEEKVDGFLSQLGFFASMLSGFKPAIVNKTLEAIEAVGSDALLDGGALDIAAKIEERINQMDIARLEELIIEVTHKQLRHITLFGGVLGAVIGLVQAVISLML